MRSRCLRPRCLAPHGYGHLHLHLNGCAASRLRTPAAARASHLADRTWRLAPRGVWHLAPSAAPPRLAQLAGAGRLFTGAALRVWGRARVGGCERKACLGRSACWQFGR